MAERLTAVARLFRNREAVGYKVTNNAGKMWNLTRDETWQLAKDGHITNMKGVNYHKCKLLRGVKIKLVDLPTLNI
jgi:hypothetical protein